MCTSDIFLGVLAILFPPLPVWVKRGICSADSLINILLCMLGFIPGLLHAWYIIAKHPDLSEYDILPQDAEAGRVTYVYVQPQSRRPANHANCHSSHHGARPQQPQGYGTVNKPIDAPIVSQGTNGTWNMGSNPEQAGDHGEGSSANPPPSYAQAVKGDHKVQNHD